jgi:L-alanine-DL-glutamate epimerase-like enolase superfamily enzyme
LDAKLTGCPVWQLMGLSEPRPVLTTFTCGADDPDGMAAASVAFESARAIKLKLTGEPLDADRVRAVRQARPDVWMSIDANQGFTLRFLEQLMPVLLEADVRLIEQPLPVGQEGELAGFASPIPLLADESVQSARDIPALAGCFAGINIKLDKCGGLTEGLRMIHCARELGLQTMVGNMIASSLGFAPAFLLAQLGDFADLDGPVFLASDRSLRMRYVEGHAVCPEALWGN